MQLQRLCRRNLPLWVLLLSIVTFGIYQLYLVHCFAKETNTACAGAQKVVAAVCPHHLPYDTIDTEGDEGKEEETEKAVFRKCFLRNVCGIFYINSEITELCSYLCGAACRYRPVVLRLKYPYILNLTKLSCWRRLM